MGGVLVKIDAQYVKFKNRAFKRKTDPGYPYKYRLSLHVHPDHLIEFKDYLIRQFRRIPYVKAFKIEGGRRRAMTILDNLVIYFRESPDSGTQHRDHLLQIVTAMQDWLANDHAAMLQTMGPGIGYARQDEGGHTFGGVRSDAMANGVFSYMIKENKIEIDRDQFIYAAKEGLKSGGIDLSHPYHAPITVSVPSLNLSGPSRPAPDLEPSLQKTEGGDQLFQSLR